MSGARRTRLGAWRCPATGNSVDAYIVAGDDRIRQISMEWDRPPPLVPEDLAFYLGTVLPELTRLVSEYLERPGRALVVLA